MTRRDYILLAEALLNGRANYPKSFAQSVDFREGYNSATREVSMALARHNPRFDQPRFMQESGATGNGRRNNSTTS